MNKCIVDEKAMLAFGADLARQSKPGSVIYLQGELGAGKTTLARGFLRAKGVRGFIKSPSYALLEVYELPAGQIVHLDLYRLQAANELQHLGLSDYLTGSSILLIEWPEKAEAELPAPSFRCQISIDGEKRRLTLYSE